MVYEYKNQNYMYWAHLDDTQEVAAFISKVDKIDDFHPSQNNSASSPSKKEIQECKVNYIIRAFKVHEKIKLLQK